VLDARVQREEAWRAETVERVQIGVRNANLLALLVTPFFLLLDRWLFPAEIVTLGTCRLAIAVASGLSVWLLRTSFGGRHPWALGVFGGAVNGFANAGMTLVTGGFASPYNAGFTLIVLCAAVLVPWSARWTALVAALVLAGSALRLLVLPLGDPHFAVTSTGGFLIMSVVATVGTAVRERLHRKSFARRLEIAEVYRGRSESDARHRAILEAALDCIVSIDHAGRIVEFNPAAERTFGRRHADVEGEDLVETIIPPPLREAHAREFAEYIAAAGTEAAARRMETTAMRADGSELPVEIVLTRIPMDGPPQFTAYLRDVTERKRAEAARRRREEHFRALTENSLDVVMILDAAGVVRYANRSVRPTLGWDSRELVGMTAWDLVHPDDRERALSSFRAVAPTPGATTGVALRYRHRDGSWRDLDVAARNLLGDDLVRGVLLNARDVTEARRAAEASRRAGEAALEASRVKSEFLANMSHEIRTPMNAILGLTDLLLDTTRAPEQREYLETIKQSAESLLALLNDVLDFSKVEAGKLELEVRPFSVRRTVDDVLRTFALEAHRKRLELAHRVAADVPDVLHGDAMRLRQVLVNLVGNAIKFTKAGEVVVRVLLEAAEPEAVALHVAVADTGIGVPEAQRTRIFEAFAQADGSTTRRYGGTGLGLAIASRLVAMMGGRIWVESEVGRGSVFHVTVRLARPADAAGARRDPPPFAGRRALVVDDNATARDVLVDLLGDLGARAEAVADAPTALAALVRGHRDGDPFAALLVDADLPGTDGRAIAEAVARDARLAGTRIVLLASAASPSPAGDAGEAGAVARVRKPVAEADLVRALAADGGAAGSGGGVSSGAVPATLAGRRVLVVEDSAVNRVVVVRLLERAGVVVAAAADGRQALAALERERFDAVLMDVQMPGIDGFETTREIRARGLDLPVVALTARVLPTDEARCRAAGMDAFLPKPVDAAALYATLERLATSGAGASAASSAAARNVPQRRQTSQ